MNPHNVRTILWIKQAYEAAERGACCVSLIPARTDTRWWHDYVMRGGIRFLCGRVKIAGAKHGASFPSVVVIFRPPTYCLQTYVPAPH